MYIYALSLTHLSPSVLLARQATDPCLIPTEGWHRGNWSATVSQYGHIVISNSQEPSQLLILMLLGFCFVGKRGNAILVDSAGLSKQSEGDVRAMLAA